MNSPQTKTKAAKTRILLIEDHEVVREGVRALINAQEDMTVVGEANNGRDGVRLVRELQPHIVVMDISMPEMNGLKATEKLQAVSPSSKIITLTRHAETGFVQQLLRVGVAGYVLKQSPSTELIRAVRVVAAGGSYLDPAITEKVMSGYVGNQSRAK